MVLFTFPHSNKSINLPPELLQTIFGKLDGLSLLACMLTSREWHAFCERTFYTSPRLSSAEGMAAFLRLLGDKPYVADYVRHLHIRGKANYSSRMGTEWILTVPGHLAHVLPKVRMLKFENIESVTFNATFWNWLERFQTVTELELTNCRLPTSYDLRNMIFAFPALSTLTIAHVRYVWQPDVECHMQARWNRILPLKKLRLEDLAGIREHMDVLQWLKGSYNVQELHLARIPGFALYVVGDYLTGLAESGGSLESFTFSPLIMEGANLNYLPAIYPGIRLQKRLNALHLHVISMYGKTMDWVPGLFDNARDLPIQNISVDFTLDLDNASSTSSTWLMMNERLSRYWRKTLREVTLTHNPVGQFLQDAQVLHVLKSRFPDLVERGILDVQIGVRYLDN
ncbi:hypothetical protein C8Q74DRAFT_1217176 [Fomes fomentarius]|nr:hypothetical protein C8Q74DRAFT_1217176 [Fomes fomentarius]